MAERSKRQGIVPLGKALSGGIGDQRAVKKAGDGQPSAVEQELPGGRGEQVFTANDFADLHRVIVGDDGQLVGRKTVLAPDDEVAEVATGNALDAAGASIDKRDCLSVGDAKAPIHGAGIGGFATGVGRGAELRWKDRFRRLCVLKHRLIVGRQNASCTSFRE